MQNETVSSRHQTPSHILNRCRRRHDPERDRAQRPPLRPDRVLNALRPPPVPVQTLRVGVVRVDAVADRDVVERAHS